MKALYLILTVAALSGAAALGEDSGFTVAQRTLAWSKSVRVTNDFGKVRILQ